MSKISTYPVITTSHFAETVAFYEDTFGFIPFYETDGYVRLSHKDEPSAILVVIQEGHQFLPDACVHSEGQILTLATDNLEATYDTLYHEGVQIVKEPTVIASGLKHFMVADPNNSIFISIVSPPPFGAACSGQC